MSNQESLITGISSGIWEICTFRNENTKEISYLWVIVLAHDKLSGFVLFPEDFMCILHNTGERYQG